jgi:signal transduction histidine kinase
VLVERDVTSAAPINPPLTRSVDELWLDVLQQISARTAHELKGALNGVAVNLEVVRSRSARSDAAALSVAPFASSAADQLDAVVGMSEALLTLARAPRDPLDMNETIDRFVSLLSPSARADGCSLRLEGASRETTAVAVRAPGNVVRLAIGAALLAALARKGDIRCKVDVGDDVVVHIEFADAEQGGPLELSPDVSAAADAAGIRVHAEGQSMALTFPRAAAGSARKRTHERA